MTDIDTPAGDGDIYPGKTFGVKNSGTTVGDFSTPISATPGQLAKLKRGFGNALSKLTSERERSVSLASSVRCYYYIWYLNRISWQCEVIDRLSLFYVMLCTILFAVRS